MKNLKEISRIKWAVLRTFGQGENQFLLNLLPENNDESYTLKIINFILHFFYLTKRFIRLTFLTQKHMFASTLLSAKKIRIQIKSVSRNAVFTYLQNTKNTKDSLE